MSSHTTNAITASTILRGIPFLLKTHSITFFGIRLKECVAQLLEIILTLIVSKLLWMLCVHICGCLVGVARFSDIYR